MDFFFQNDMGNWLSVQKNTKFGGAWVAQSVSAGLLISAQIRISGS